jgi:hypothetical protein
MEQRDAAQPQQQANATGRALSVDQFYDEITKIREDNAKIREMLAAHTPQIAQIPDIARAVNQLTTQQTALQGQLNVLQAEMIAQKVWQQAMEAWRNETPNIFIPRKEHEAQGLPLRVMALEQAVLTSQIEAKNAQLSDKREQLSLLEQFRQHRFAMISLIVMSLISTASVILSLINILR